MLPLVLTSTPKKYPRSGFCFNVLVLSNLNNYFGLHVCLSFRGYVCHTLRFQVALQNVTNKCSLVCVKSEKYAFWVTLRLLGSMQQGKAELHILELTSVFHHLPSVGPKQLCALAHLGCTREAETF